MRLGSYYRAVVAASLGIAPTGPRVLDVGVGDGELLRRFPEVCGVALDVVPRPAAGASFVLADGRKAPFRAGSFDTVFAFDVLEHVPEDALLMEELVRLVRPGGTLWISVPSRDFRAFPPFVTGFLHRQWGHVRPGYRPSDLRAMVPPQAEGILLEWNEPVYRLGYLFLKGLSLGAPWLVRWLLRHVVLLDRAFSAGHHGHYFCRICVPSRVLAEV